MSRRRRRLGKEKEEENISNSQSREQPSKQRERRGAKAKRSGEREKKTLFSNRRRIFIFLKPAADVDFFQASSFFSKKYEWNDLLLQRLKG